MGVNLMTTIHYRNSKNVTVRLYTLKLTTIILVQAS